MYFDLAAGGRFPLSARLMAAHLFPAETRSTLAAFDPLIKRRANLALAPI